MSRGLFFQEGLLRGQVCMEQAGEDNPQGKQGQEDGGAGYVLQATVPTTVPAKKNNRISK